MSGTPHVYDDPMERLSAPVEARHKALVDALPDLLLRLRADGTYLEIGGDTSKLANPPDRVVGSSAYELLPADIAERLMDCVRASLEQNRLATVEYTLRTHLGEEREFEVRAAPAGPDEVVAVVRDVTDLRRAMRDLTDSRARIVAAGDAERRRVERNLHDGAQQRLVTVALHLHLVKRRLETDPTEVPQLVESAQTELALALEEIRELVRGLHPRLLSDRGLEPALAGLAERALLPVEIAEMPSERLPPAVEAAAYYLVAEALANAGKHSQASQVRVRVSADETRTEVEVVDDGVGGADLETGSGLRGLADRVAALGGALDVVSEPGRGTALRATLPHDHPNQ
jgi:signal transduction histidine kinase